jgi:hypothetical protein
MSRITSLLASKPVDAALRAAFSYPAYAVALTLTLTDVFAHEAVRTSPESRALVAQHKTPPKPPGIPGGLALGLFAAYVGLFCAAHPDEVLNVPKPPKPKP